MKKIIALLCICFAVASCLGITVLAEGTNDLIDAAESIGEPIPGADEQEENTEASIPASLSGLSGASALLTEQKGCWAILENYKIEIAGTANSAFAAAAWTYSAETPEVISFFDDKGWLNVAYENSEDGKIRIQRYNDQMQLVDQLQITKRYPQFGNVTCDENGNYYIVWGQTDTLEENCVTMCVSKYDYSGQFVAECAMNGKDTAPYTGSNWGTKTPFKSSNCSVAINNGVLACNYGRTMYNGHQSNYVFYIDIGTMTRISAYGVPYCSHSFDQRVIGLSRGGFLTADHGDAYSRGFEVAVTEQVGAYSKEITSFHFREGANRSYGYNETYAQLGGIAETENGYVLCGSSEKTLSLEPAPTNQSYCGHSEARDLFVQILKKDFYNYSGAEAYLVSGETRAATGTAPASASTQLFLREGTVDYGVIWLTDYDDSYYAANPKVLTTDDNKIVVMWEKLSYSTHTGESYFAVLSEDGTVYQDAVLIKNVRLAGNVDPVYKDGKVYWATSDENGDYIHVLTVEGKEDFSTFSPETPNKIVNVVSGIHVYWNEIDGISKYGLWRSETGKDGTYQWLANPTTWHFTDTKVTSGKTYYYKITAMDTDLNMHSAKSEAIGITYVSTPDITSRFNKAAGVSLGWDKITGATGYGIYRKSYDGNDAWVRIATIEGNSTFNWVDTSVKGNNGTVYRYTIRALAGSSMDILSGCRNTGRTMVRLASRTLSAAAKTSATSIKCTWSTSSAVTGYEVRFMVGDEVYKTYTIGNYKTGTKTFTNLPKGKTYKIQVRAYKKVDGVGSFYSAWSTAKNVTL